MSSGPSDYRRRSRSPVVPVGDIARLLNEQPERFSEHLRRNRWGKQQQRTSKSLLLTLLEYYLFITQFAVDASGHAASYVRRQTAGGFRDKVNLSCCVLKIRSTLKLCTHLRIRRRKKRRRNLSGDHRSRTTHRRGGLVSRIIHRQGHLHLREWCQELQVW